MKKLNKVAVLFASAALAAPFGAFAQAKSADNWKGAFGNVWKNGSNELCWRDAMWTPATADEACDGVIKAAPPPPP
ncbi:MAG: OmpA family protein, partial [Rubrivivax sp.]